MNDTSGNAFTKSWDFVSTIVQYIFARYGESWMKMWNSYSKVDGGNTVWNARAFFAGLGELVYMTGLIVFFLYLCFAGFRTHKAANFAALFGLIILAIVSCIG